MIAETSWLESFIQSPSSDNISYSLEPTSNVLPVSLTRNRGDAGVILPQTHKLLDKNSKKSGINNALLLPILGSPASFQGPYKFLASINCACTVALSNKTKGEILFSYLVLKIEIKIACSKNII
jgi:MFS-type transporter involved in bile tolerance (Atg22 family)